MDIANESKITEVGESNTPETNVTDMPPKDREDQVLNFFVEHGFPLPPKALYRALKVTEEITYGYRTVQNILGRLHDDGFLMRLDKDELDKGRIVPLADDQSNRRTYYFITDKGRDRLTIE
jgi:hypothetical protein